MKHTILFGCLSLVVAAVPVAAQVPVITGERIDDGSITRVVRFADLDISTTFGERTLVRRVRGAVREVCTGAVNFSVEAQCKSYAWNGAKPQLARALDLARLNPAGAVAALAAIRISAPR